MSSAINNYLQSIYQGNYERFLKNDPSSTELSLTKFDVDTDHVAEALKINAHLKLFKLNKCKVKTEGVRLIATSICANKQCSIEILQLISADIGKYAGKAFDELFSSSLTLIEVNLANNSLGDVGAEGIIAGLQINRSIRVLNLRNNGLTDKSAIALANMLPQNGTLLELNLSKNEVSENTIEAFAKVLTTKEVVLQKLNLNKNHLAGSIDKIMKALIGNTFLSELRVAYCDLYDVDFEAISDMLQSNRNRTLRVLDLSGNHLIKSLPNIAKALKVNRSLHAVYFKKIIKAPAPFSDIHETSAVSRNAEQLGLEMASMLKTNRSLKILDLSDNRILSDNVCEAFIAALEVNKSLQKLFLNGNPLVYTTNLGEKFVGVFEKNLTLIEINLFGTNILNEDQQEISRLVELNKKRPKEEEKEDEIKFDEQEEVKEEKKEEIKITAQKEELVEPKQKNNDDPILATSWTCFTIFRRLCGSSNKTKKE